MKKTLQLLSTNWIHLPGFYLMTYVFFIVSKVFGMESDHETWESILFVTPLTIPFLFLLYGPLIIAGFYAALMGLDVLCFTLTRLRPGQALVLEWLLIVPIFIQWAFDYHYWLWLALALSFLITQAMRKPTLARILKAPQRA